MTVKRIAAQRSLTAGVLNVRSLGNKSSAVNEMIVDKSLDVLAVVITKRNSVYTERLLCCRACSAAYYSY